MYDAWRGYACSALPDGGGATASPEDAASGGTRAPAAGVLDELSGALAAARATFSNFLALVSLEARRAGMTLVWMVACGIVAGICIAATWLGLMAMLVMWAVAAGLHPVAAVLAAVCINGAAGIALIYACFSMSRDLLFTATRRQVAGKSPVTP